MKDIKYCQKIYSDLPFGHRQHKHNGHCSLIHGHSWTFEFEFAAEELDEAGFVIDFGGLKKLKQMINEEFDHTLVLNQDDPLRPAIEAMGIAKVTVVDSCSSEGIAKYLADDVAWLVDDLTSGRAWLYRVTVHEDSKNSATIYPPKYESE